MARGHRRGLTHFAVLMRKLCMIVDQVMGKEWGENTEGHSYKDKKMLYIGRTGWVKTVVLNFYTEPVGVLEGSCL